MNQELLRDEQAKKILEDIKQEHDLAMLDEIVKDNKIEFVYKNERYRVRLLNFGEKEEFDRLRRKKFGELIKESDVLLESDLIEQYKKRGINIDELNDTINKLEREKDDLLFKCGEAISNKIDQKVTSTYIDKITEIKEKIYVITIQKTHLLSYSLEKQLREFAVKLLAYLSLEKSNNNRWDRVYNTLKDFDSSLDEPLVEKAIYYTMLLN